MKLQPFTDRPLFIMVTALILVERYAKAFNIQSKMPTMLRPLTDQIDLEHPINFGVSLAILQTKPNRTVLLAGAPAADLGDSNERPGQIFNCDLDDSREQDKSGHSTDNKTNREPSDIDCKPIKISALTKGHNKPIAVNDFMQLGASISSLSNGRFTVCAPGALNLYFSDHYPNGQCWTGNYSSSPAVPIASSARSPSDELQLNGLFAINPLNDTKRQIFENTYFFSHGMFGFSSKISKVCSW